MNGTDYTKIRVLCKRNEAHAIADKLSSMFHLMTEVLRPQDAPNEHTLWVEIPTWVPYSLVKRISGVDGLLSAFGVTSLSAVPGVVAYQIEPYSEDIADLMRSHIARAKSEQVKRTASIKYADDPESNRTVELNQDNVSDWPTPLQPMAAYILAPSFMKFELVMDMSHYTVTSESYEHLTEHDDIDDIAASMRTPDLGEDMEERLARQEQRHIEDRQQLGQFGHYIPREDIP